MARSCSIDARPGPLGRIVSAQAAGPRGPLGRAMGHLWVRETAGINDRAVEVVGPGAGDHVLEIGCGPGRTVAAMADRGARVTAIDPSPVMVAQARGRNRKHVAAGIVQVLAGGVGSMPPLDDPVDVVVTVHTIYFWPGLEAGLREIRRALRSGGRIVVGFRPRELGRPRRLDPAVYRIPTTGQLVDGLGACGFVDVVTHDAATWTIVEARTPPERVPA